MVPMASNFRSVRELMKTSLAAALASLVFAYVTPAFAADPTDARLVADITLAKATIALLQSRDFIGVRERLDPAIGSFSDDVLGRMSGVVAGETQSIETVSSKGSFSPGTGNRESQTILEYHIGSRWVAADVVIKTENNIQRVSGLYFSVNNQPLQDSSVLSGKGFVQYAFLAGWSGIIGLTGYAMILAFRRHSGWRRWVLTIAMPVGLGPAVAMNWSNAAFWTFGGSVTNSAATFYPIFTGRFPMAWFGMFGGAEFRTPYFYVSVPLIAIGYLAWAGYKGVRNRTVE
jgi:hypothetical protein